jgi:hypothetical protein
VNAVLDQDLCLVAFGRDDDVKRHEDGGPGMNLGGACRGGSRQNEDNPAGG